MRLSSPVLPPLLCPGCLREITNSTCPNCGSTIPLREGVLQLTDQAYAGSFGAQWRAFARTQLDSASGTRISEERFADLTGWQPSDLAGKTVLDAGCGSGRFTEIAANWGAQVTALDLSEAVYAARANIREPERIRFVQANALSLPFPKRSFDLAFSIGVAQHTPDPLGFVREVAEAVRPGGRTAFWIYERRLTAMLRPKYLLRPITRRLPMRWNMALASGLVAAFLPIARGLESLPGPARQVGIAALPIAVRIGPTLSRKAQREWSVLDTIDWYSPAFDNPQRSDDVEATLKGAGARRVQRGAAAGTTRAWF